MEKLLPCLLMSACFLALFGRPWRAWLVLWLLCLWWLPLAVGVRATNGTVINATLAGMAFATSPAELRELASAIPSAWFAFFVLWNVTCMIVLYGLLQHRHWRWSGSFRSKVVFFCICMLALPYVVLPRVHEPDTGWEVVATKTSDPFQAFSQADQNVGIAARLPEAFPYELPKAVAQYLQARRVVDATHARLQPPALSYTPAGAHPQAEVVVLVVGESSTRNAWHWFNPQAPATTPLLEARAARGEALFGFDRTLAQTTSTRQAVPSMLTAQPLVWPDGTPNPQATRSIVWEAAQAGYATAWFSNQAAVGKHDGIIASYAQEAGATAFLNPSVFSQQGSLDVVLLPALRNHLAKNPRVFVVLHTMGSHFDYRHRYPKGFGPYPQAQSTREAYFNSVAYTDFVLDQIMTTLALDGRRAALVYAADHGETIPDGVCRKDAANRSTRDAYEVPALLWLSPAYAQANPQAIAALKANASRPYTTAVVHQTLRDLLAGDEAVQTPALAQASSFLRAPPTDTVQRVVYAGTKWVDFQEAAARNPCFIKAP